MGGGGGVLHIGLSPKHEWAHTVVGTQAHIIKFTISGNFSLSDNYHSNMAVGAKICVTVICKLITHTYIPRQNLYLEKVASRNKQKYYFVYNTHFHEA